MSFGHEANKNVMFIYYTLQLHSASYIGYSVFTSPASCQPGISI